MKAPTRDAIEAKLKAAAGICARQGAQLTEIRRQVLGLILESRTPLTAYQLLDRLKETRKAAAPPTVYRALDFLMEQHLVHKVERLNAFVSCVQAGHEHGAMQFLICRQCGTVAEIHDSGVVSALEHAAERVGFHSDNSTVEIDGRCALCSQQT